MKKLRYMTFIILTFACGYANAATFTFDGDITYHNDIVQIGFTLNDDAYDVRVWTDSYLWGTNFDPITALWNASDNSLIQENDDNESIGAGQTSWDSGFWLTFLSAGDYFFTVQKYGNPAAGNNLSDGFQRDADTPILVGTGTYWRVNLDGVDSATQHSATQPSAVPVPAAVWLFGTALVGLVGFGKRKSKVAV